jgi:hypothetical protein
MQNTDIAELQTHSREEIVKITSQVESGEINKVALKNILENLRSTLDYLARDVVLHLKNTNPNVKEKVYFPYGQRENHFKSSIKKNFPTLKSSAPEIYDVIEAIQPFKQNHNWLTDLCGLTNDAKHNFLSKTENIKTTMVNQPGFGTISGTNITMSNNYVNGVRQDDVHINPKGEATVAKHAGTTIITHNNHIKFQGKEIEIVPFIALCHTNIEKLAKDIWALLNV